MKYYYLNKKANDDGVYVVHSRDCHYFALIARKVSLGAHGTCKAAMKKAKSYHKKVDGCFYCCPNCFSG